MLLFIRSRNLLWTLGGCTAVALIILALGSEQLILAYGSGAGIPYATIFPLFCACLVGLSTRSPFTEFEQSVARPMAMLRLCGILAVLFLSMLGVGMATWHLPGSVSGGAALRNLLGLSGLALLTAAFTGSRTSWVLPCSCVVTTLSLSTGSSDGLWAWLLRPNNDLDALAVALTLAAVGAAAVALRGAPEAVQEK